MASVGRRFRTAVRIAFYCILLAVIVFPIFFITATFFGVGHTSAFEDLPGEDAQALVIGWPETVSAADVQTVSYKYERGMDNHSAWYRVRLTPKRC